MTIDIKDLVPGTERPAVQQLATLEADKIGLQKRIVRVTDEDYTLDRLDRLVVLSSSTSTGNYTLTLPSGLPDGWKVDIVLPSALGGTDAFVTSGHDVGELTFDAEGDHATLVYLADEDEWHTLNNGIA